jgi:hypothetical protein
VIHALSAQRFLELLLDGGGVLVERIEDPLVVHLRGRIDIELDPEPAQPAPMSGGGD